MHFFYIIHFIVIQEHELSERRAEQEMEEFRKRIVEEERARLLREHAPKLLGYLPKVSTQLLALCRL